MYPLDGSFVISRSQKVIFFTLAQFLHKLFPLTVIGHIFNRYDVLQAYEHWLIDDMVTYFYSIVNNKTLARACYTNVNLVKFKILIF